MAKTVIIDEKGKLFGLINLLDLIVLIALLVLVYLGSSAYLALKTSDPQLVDFSPKQINNEKANKVTLVLKNDRIIGSAKITMIPHGFAGAKIQLPTTFDKRNRNQVTVVVPADAAPGSYLFELELAVSDVLNRQSSNLLRLATPIAVMQKVGRPYPWPVEVDVFFPGDSTVISKQLKAGDRMSDSHGRQIAEILSIRPSKPSDILNLEEAPDKGGITARVSLQPEILEKQLAFQGKAIDTGQQIKFNTESAAVAGYITGRGEVKYQKVDKGGEVLAEVVMMGITKENAGLLKPKAVQIDESGNVWAEFLELTQEESLTKGPFRNTVARMFLNCDNREGGLYCQDRLIEPGAFLAFSLKNQAVTGLVRKIYRPAWIRVMVEFQNVTPEIAPLLRGGVKEEGTGQEVTMSIDKVISSRSSYNYQRPYPLLGPIEDGKRTFIGHPENRDIECQLRIKAIRTGKRIYYNKERLLINSPIIFQTSTWSSGGQITRFIF